MKGIRRKMGIRAIARQIGRDPGVVCREVQRNTVPRGYKVVIAKKLTEQRAKRIKPRKLDKDISLRTFVVHWIREGLSPEEVVGRLRKKPPQELRGHSISHESIYNWIYEGCIQTPMHRVIKDLTPYV